MKTRHYRISRPASLLVLIGAGFLLASCGESNNLNNPGTSGPVTRCSELANTTCVSGRFIADAVTNLNYECGDDSAKISGVTDIDGSFSCPLNKTVTFSLVNPDTTIAATLKHKIVLGSTLVKMPAELGQSAGNQFVNEFFYVTPTTISSGSTTTANNITRLLQGIRVPDGRVVQDAARRVVIDDLDKKQLKSPYLTADILAADFAVTANLQTKLGPWLAQIGKTLETPANATATLGKSLYGTVSGIYFVPGYLVNVGTATACSNTVSTSGLYYGGLCGLNASNYFLGATWGMVDRRGRIVGFGVYSEGSIAPPVATPAISQAEWDACKLLVQVGDPAGTSSSTIGCQGTPKKQPDRLPLAIQDPSTTVFWPTWSADGRWDFGYSLLSNSDVDLARTLLLNGTVDRDAIAGSDFLYSNYYNGETRGTNTLGVWSMGSTYLQTQTRFSMQRARTISPTLDPSFWCVSTDTDCARAATFPMNVALTFYSDRKADGSACASATDVSCKLPNELHITILRDGNIVSNLHGACGVYTDENALVSAGGQDFPVGVVAQAYGIETRSYASVMLTVPYRNEFPGLKGIQIGTTTASAVTLPARLRIDAAAAASTKLNMYSEYSKSTSDGSLTALSADVASTAIWTNEYRFLKGEINSYGVVMARKEDNATLNCPI